MHKGTGPCGKHGDSQGCVQQKQGRYDGGVCLCVLFLTDAHVFVICDVAIQKAVEAGEDVNEVEAAGNTPLHCAAYAGWEEGCEILLSLGAKVNASNNAGDRPWHWAKNMGHTGVMSLLEKAGASRENGFVLVQDHVPKVKDFFQKECWAHHPKPHADFIEWKLKQDKIQETERNKLIPGM